jgi:hypothetical protein
MTKKTPWRPAAPPRSTVPLGRTVAKTQAALDFASHLAIDYAQQWLTRHGSKKVPSAGIIRRALACYLDHLDGHRNDPTADPRDEVRAVARACAGSVPDTEAQQQASARLRGAATAPQLSPWLEVLHGPQRLAELAALDVRADATFQQLKHERSQHLRQRRPATPQPPHNLSTAAHEQAQDP